MAMVMKRAIARKSTRLYRRATERKNHEERIMRIEFFFAFVRVSGPRLEKDSDSVISCMAYRG